MKNDQAFQGVDETEHADKIFEGLIFKGKKFTSKKFYNCVFRNCELTAAEFSYCRLVDCIFESSNLSLIKVTDTDFGESVFRDSKLVGVNWIRAAWPKVKLSGPPQFINCVLSDSNFMGLPLSGVVISGCLARDADFREANLSGADLSKTDFTGSLFGSTDLSGANLAGAINYSISLSNNKVKNAKFSMPEAMALLYCMDIKIV